MLCRSRLNWVRPLSLCLTLSAMSGCAIGSTGLAPASSYCAISRPIGYDSKADTPETVAQIEAHNSKFVCVCEHDCPVAVKAAEK